jgi:ribosomal protein S18 acetylase RimI-like enzyme
MLIVSTTDIVFSLLDGPAAATQVADLRGLHAEVYADPPYEWRDDDVFDERFGVHRRQPGFALAAAHRGGYLIGYAAGMPLRPATSWWRDVTTTLPEDVTAEYPGRTFALLDLIVRSSWRRQGVGRGLHQLILMSRREERATLAVLPSATAAQHAFRQWGWRRIARTRGGRPESEVSDVLVLPLPVTHQSA